MIGFYFIFLLPLLNINFSYSPMGSCGIWDMAAGGDELLPHPANMLLRIDKKPQMMIASSLMPNPSNKFTVHALQFYGPT